MELYRVPRPSPTTRQSAASRPVGALVPALAQPDLAGSLAGVGTVTGGLSTTPRLSGALSGAGTVTGALTTPAKLAGTVAGTGTATGALVTTPVLGGTLAGVSTATGALRTTPAFGGTLAGAATAGGGLTTTPVLGGSLAGAGTATAALLTVPALSGSLTASGTATGDLTTGTAAKTVSTVLRLHDGSLLSSITVKYAIHSYGGGSPANGAWMAREQSGTAATDGLGNFAVTYTGSANVGEQVYLSILSPDATPAESMLWPLAVS